MRHSRASCIASASRSSSSRRRTSSRAPCWKRRAPCSPINTPRAIPAGPTTDAARKPSLIVAGASAYSRNIDWARFRKVADEIGAFFMVDMAHYAGLVAAGVYPSPLPHAHVVTTTTHKTLRGPRGGMVLSTDAEIGKKINSAVFPGLQGGPLIHIIAAKACAFGEALRPDFKVYAQNVIDNARVLAAALTERGLKIVSGGTDSHVMLVDLRPTKATGGSPDEVPHPAGITRDK